MKRFSIIVALTFLATSGFAQSNTATNIQPGKSQPTSIQEMLAIGPSPLKLHSLAMITQGKVTGDIDDSFLPAFKACVDDPVTPVRNMTAKLLGEHYVVGKETPNPDAVALLLKLARDEASDVQFSAIYHGLSQVKNKSDEIVEQLIEAAADNREQMLYERITESLADNTDQVARLLDAKLKNLNSIDYYEIYPDLTGRKPTNAEKYLDMPSSRPKVFVIGSSIEDAAASKEDLEKLIRSGGIENPDAQLTSWGKGYSLMLKTYITRDNETAKALLTDHDKFKISQELWLSPALEIQIEAMQKNLK